MLADPKPSFSPYRKWGIGLQVALLIAVVFAVLVMVNYLSHDHFYRFHLSARTKIPLSTQTTKFLQSLTNQVKIVAYYDQDDPFYSMVLELLNEYKSVSSKLSLQMVDYLRDPGTATLLKDKYAFLASPNAKNLVIFDCDGKIKPVEGNALAKFTIEVPADGKEYRKRAIAFMGESLFTAALLAVTSPKPLKAYFLTGHDEHDIGSDNEATGYLKFTQILQQNCIQVERLKLLGTNPVPMDCNLLVIAGPVLALPDVELEKVDQYLNQGGRLLALFNYLSLKRGETGLEKILAKWGVQVTPAVVRDPENYVTENDVIVRNFSEHAMVAPLQGFALQMVLPRWIGRLNARTQPADAPHVEEVAFAGPKSFIVNSTTRTPKAYPLIVAVEKGAIKGVITERGTTRIVVAGDSTFLVNYNIKAAHNRDFAGYLANWLLDRSELIQGPGPTPIKEYRFVMTRTQLQSMQLVLLAGMPGGALLVGSLVWLRRRK